MLEADQAIRQFWKQLAWK